MEVIFAPDTLVQVMVLEALQLDSFWVATAEVI